MLSVLSTNGALCGVAVNMYRLLFVLLAVVWASVLGLPGLGSKADEPCVAPLQWEGRWVVYDHGTGRNHRAAVSYDGLNKRLRVLQQHKKHTPCQKYVVHFVATFIWSQSAIFLLIGISSKITMSWVLKHAMMYKWHFNCCDLI